MIILDTDVIAEMQKVDPDPNVIAWLDTLDSTTTYITAITVTELLLRIERLPSGKRRTALAEAVDRVINSDFKARILAFDATSASIFGHLVAAAEGSGFAVGFSNGAVAAIARANKFCTVATRNETAFAAMRIETINPWAGRMQLPA